jgi:hypothetical protein
MSSICYFCKSTFTMYEDQNSYYKMGVRLAGYEPSPRTRGGDPICLDCLEFVDRKTDTIHKCKFCEERSRTPVCTDCSDYTNGDAYGCRFCDKVFDTDDQLIYHLAINKITERNFNCCFFCNEYLFEFGVERLCQTGMVHVPDYNSYVCTNCNVKYNQD